MGLTNQARASTNGVADQLWNGIISRFMEKLVAKDLEVEALKKQVGLLQHKIEISSAPELQRQLELEKANKQHELSYLQSQLEETRRAKELEVRALEERLAAVEEYKKASEESQRKLDDLQRAIEERNESERQKASETADIREQLSSLSAKLQQSQTPFWKKWFSSNSES